MGCAVSLSRTAKMEAETDMNTQINKMMSSSSDLAEHISDDELRAPSCHSDCDSARSDNSVRFDVIVAVINRETTSRMQEVRKMKRERSTNRVIVRSKLRCKGTN
mmetsp:Transcript_32930/g.87359  ORF Transcript_32930/g.87359 Transcript_32930/m.87359 type:complete len:105 (+) Transcript_32930:150-464(+)